jgi:hypothetical protein
VLVSHDRGPQPRCRCRPSGSRRGRRRSWPPENSGAISASGPADCSSPRQLPKASSRLRRSSTLSVGHQANPRPEMDMGRSGSSRQLRWGRATLLRVRAAAASIAARLIASLVAEPWSAETRPTDGTELLRSALGPCRNGRAWTRAVNNGHQRPREPAGQPAPNSGSSHDASGRIRLWSRRSRGLSQHGPAQPR